MASVITVTTQPIPDPQTSTLTHYQEVASNLIEALDAFVTAIPKLGEAEASEAKQVRRNLNVPDAFCRTAIAAAGQNPELETVKVHAEKNRNRLQFLEAFRLVDDKIDTVSRRLKHALFAVKSEVAGDSLEVYRMVRARVKRSPALAALAEALKRDLGRRVPTKAEREERKARLFQQAVDKAVAQRLGVQVLTQEKEVKAA